MTSALEQTAIDEAALLDYPMTRRPASCQRWGRRTKIALSRQGCAFVLGMHDVDMGAMSRSDRAAAEKVYGALLSDRGCLRKQLGHLHVSDVRPLAKLAQLVKQRRRLSAQISGALLKPHNALVAALTGKLRIL